MTAQPSGRVRRPIRSTTPPRPVYVPPPPPKPKAEKQKVTLYLPKGGFVGFVFRITLDFLVVVVFGPTWLVVPLVILAMLRVIVLAVGFLFPSTFPTAAEEFRGATDVYGYMANEIYQVVRSRLPFKMT